MGRGAPNLTLVGGSRKLPSIAVGFLVALRAAGRTEKTASTYQEALHQLQRFSEETGMPSPEHMSAEHLREFLLSLYARGNSTATVRNRHASLQSFYRWLVGEGERADNPLSRIPLPKAEEKVQAHYTLDDVSRLLVGCQGRDLLSIRDTALVLLLFDSGLRAAELCGATLDGLDLKQLSLTVRGKGGKHRVVGVGYKCAKALDKYLRRRRDDSPYLFVTRSARPMGFNTVRLLLERRFAEAGLQYHGAHAFRRGFAIAYLDSGGSPEDLRVLAGWDSPQMLRRYTRATERERALRGHRAHSPGDKLR